jgi:glycosyltransferase involved in cell wall biosynthesis
MDFKPKIRIAKNKVSINNNDFIVIVNATALDSSGALTILRQFVETIPSSRVNYWIFVSSRINLVVSQPNIRIIKKNISTLIERFFWDSFGIKKWIRLNQIKPCASISLQNTNFRLDKSIPNYVYFHNAIPLSEGKWNPVNKEERVLWFYKNIYPFFVRLYINKNTQVFVQSNNIKDRFAEYFGFTKEKIHIVVPKIKLPNIITPHDFFLNKNNLNLFYPATPFIYKNHLTILRAIASMNRDAQEKIILYLTCNEGDLLSKISTVSINFRINFMGKIDSERMSYMYQHADALLFPSYIETMGLPIIEAAACGMKVIVSDLPYSREALSGYGGAVFVSHMDVGAWKDEIMKLFQLKGMIYKPLKFKRSGSWDNLFSIVENGIKERLKGQVW